MAPVEMSQLRQIDALSSLSDEDLLQLQSRLRTRIVRGREQLFAQGDTDCSLFIVVAGRLCVIRTDETGSTRIVGEISAGELFGEIALITGESRSASAVAVRDTVLWELDEADYCTLLSKHPVLARNVTRIAVRRLRESSTGGVKSIRCQTIAVFPATRPSIVKEFVSNFMSRLSSLGSIAVVDASTFRSQSEPGREPADRELQDIEAIHRLSDLERTNLLVILVAEEGDLNWSRCCLRQADRILLVESADADASAQDCRVEWESLIGSRDLEMMGATELVVVRDSIPQSSDAVVRSSVQRSWRATFFIQTSREEDWRALCHSLIESFTAPEWLRGSPLFSNLSEPDLRLLMAEMEIVRLSARDILFQQGTPSDGLFIVINGRLQAEINLPTGAAKVVGTMGRGEVIGEISLLTEDPRTATVRALRDSTIAKLSLATWKRLANSRPGWSTSLARVVVDRLSGQRRLGNSTQAVCFAVQPLVSGHLLGGFVHELEVALGHLGKTCLIDSAAVDRRFGTGASQFDRGDPGEGLIVDWVQSQELSCDYLVYVCDDNNSAWTQRCLRQADQILLVVPATTDPGLTRLEKEVLNTDSPFAQTPRHLVLLHPSQAKSAQGTIRWLQPRSLSGHHHIRIGNANDVGRLTRLLTQRAFGLALSGGGSRGVAHIGVIRAIREAGIPVDVTYGTSAGSAFAALVGMEDSTSSMLDKCTNMLTRTLGHLLSMGPPVVSVMSGRHPNRLLQYWFEDALIEDQFVPFGMVSADLVSGDEYVHRRGLIREAARASSSLPGAWPPIVDGSRVLVDGGVVNNLPIDLVRPHCQNGKIIAVDIGGGDDYSRLTPYGLELSGWKILARKFVSSGEKADLPAMMGIISRCCTLTSANRTKRIQTDAHLLMLEPPVTQYGMFDIRTDAVIREVESQCYNYAQAVLKNWREKY